MKIDRIRRRVRDVLRMLVWLAPSGSAKNAALRRLGHRVHPSAIARPSLVWRVDELVLGPGSRLGRANVLKHLTSLALAADASIGRLNVISAHPVYKRLYSDGARLALDEHAKVTSHHHLDCSASVTIGAYSSLAGSGTTVLTHSVDLRRDAQVAHPIVLGRYCFVGTHCVLLGGAVLPDRSVLAAGSVLTRASSGEVPSGLWSGVPAAHRRPVDGAWFHRAGTHTRRVYVPASDTTVDDAF